MGSVNQTPITWESDSHAAGSEGNQFHQSRGRPGPWYIDKRVLGIFTRIPAWRECPDKWTSTSFLDWLALTRYEWSSWSPKGDPVPRPRRRSWSWKIKTKWSSPLPVRGRILGRVWHMAPPTALSDALIISTDFLGSSSCKQLEPHCDTQLCPVHFLLREKNLSVAVLPLP